MHYETLPAEIPKIINKRQQVRKLILNIFNERDNLDKLEVIHLRKIFYWYDSIFFNHEFNTMILLKNIVLKFGFMGGVSKIGEHCYNSKDNSCKISISKKTLLTLFKNGEKRLWVNGLNVRDRIEALQVVLEHEMVHMYMVLKDYSGKIKSGKGKMYYSSHGKLFQELVKRFFLHTDYRHLLTNGESTGHLTKERCTVNQKVYFKNGINKIYGIVIKCNPKKAKISSNTKIYSVPYSMLHNY